MAKSNVLKSASICGSSTSKWSPHQADLWIHMDYWKADLAEDQEVWIPVTTLPCLCWPAAPHSKSYGFFTRTFPACQHSAADMHFFPTKKKSYKVSHEIKPWWTSPCLLQSFFIFNKSSFIRCPVYCWCVHKEWDHRETGGVELYYVSFI